MTIIVLCLVSIVIWILLMPMLSYLLHAIWDAQDRFLESLEDWWRR